MNKYCISYTIYLTYYLLPDKVINNNDINTVVVTCVLPSSLITFSNVHPVFLHI